MNPFVSILIGAILIGSLTTWLAFRISSWDDVQEIDDIDDEHEIDRKIE
jgi:hypothetical protein